MQVSIDDFVSFLRVAFGDDTARELYEIGMALPDDDQYAYFSELVSRISRATGRDIELEFTHYRVQPVDVETFLLDPYYLNLQGQVYPEVMKEAIEINSGKYVEIVLTGGIGSAKTTLALWSNAYQLYLLSITRDPHILYGLDRSSELIIVFQNITEKLARTVDYPRFKELIGKSPYFQEHFPFDDSLNSEMHFPNRVIVKPVSGSSMATIGQNVIGGLIDELNYMAVIEKSARAVDSGVYNQAVEVYNSIARRRKSRFMKQGRMPGLLCLVSSKRYPGQFTDIKEKEAETDSTIYVYNKRVWDIKPDAFSTKRFRVFIGDDVRKPRILEDDEKVSADDEHLIDYIPDDFRNEFEQDIVNALRELAGRSNLTKHPFLPDTKAITSAFKKKLPSIFSREDTDFDKRELEVWPKYFVDPEKPRFCHFDLAYSGDSVGLTIGHVAKFVTLDRGAGIKETLPFIRIDGQLEVMPPRNGEVLFWKLRRLLYVIRKAGLNLRWVSFDSFQSVDSIQLLRQQGYAVGTQSMDVETTPYDFLKSALYDGRIEAPLHPKCQKELRELQIEFVKKKKDAVVRARAIIDHLPSGSKDVADSLAGVVFGLTMRREIWGSFNIPLVMIPESIKAAIAKKADKVRQGTDEEQEAA